MLHADCRILQCHPVSSDRTPDYLENNHFNQIDKLHWAVCEAPISLVGERYSSLWQLTDYQQYIHKIILTSQKYGMEGMKARSYLDDRVVGTSEGA
jgi:hypothetical protein